MVSRVGARAQDNVWYVRGKKNSKYKTVTTVNLKTRFLRKFEPEPLRYLMFLILKVQSLFSVLLEFTQ